MPGVIRSELGLVARCRYTVTGLDLQLLSQCGSTNMCLSMLLERSATNKPTNLSPTRATHKGTEVQATRKTGASSSAWFVCLFVCCLTSQQHASVSQGRICSDNFTCCHTEIEVAVCLLVGCLTSQQQASVSQGRICYDNFTCCHTEIEVADQTFYLTQSQYTDTGPTSPSADPITPGAWQGSHWSANF